MRRPPISSRVSIRTVLLVLLSVLGGWGLIASLQQTGDNLRDYRQNRTFAERGHITAQLLTAARHLAYERGRTAVVLRGAGPVSDGNRAFIDERRRLADAALDAALASIESLPQAAYAELIEQRQAITQLRRLVDHDADIPFASRDKQLADRWFGAASVFIGNIQRSVERIAGDGRPGDKTTRLTLLAAATLQLRMTAGSEASVIAQALAAGKPPTAETLYVIHEMRGREEQLWHDIERLAAAASIKVTQGEVEEVRKQHLAVFRPLQDQVLRELASRGPVLIPLEKLTSTSLPTLGGLSDLMIQSAEQAVRIGAEEEADARSNLLAHIAWSASLLFLFMLSLRYVVHNVVAPLERVDRELRRLGTLPDGNETGSEIERLKTSAVALERSLVLRAETEQRMARFVSNVPGFVYTYMSRPDGSGHFTFASPSMTDFFGVAPGDMTADGSSMLVMIHPDDKTRLVECIAASARCMQPYVLEYRILHPSKGERWVESRVAPEPAMDDGILWHGITLDITERKHLEQQLFERNQQYRALVENFPDSIARYDREGRVVYVNPVFGETLGAAADTIGTRVRERYPDGNFDTYAQAIEDVLASGEDRELEVELPGSNGASTQFHHVRMVAEHGENGEVVGVLAIGRDITARKNYEVAREAALAEAVRLAKLRSEFLSHMSHELRTPLNGILGYAQILQRDMGLNERSASALNVIRQSGEHLLALIEDILDLARIETGRVELIMSDIQLARFLSVVAEIVGVRARQKNLEFSCELAPELPEVVRGDEKRLRQVLLNLLANAVKFTDHGRVSLHVSRITPSRLAFAVQDTGIGIATNQLETIFQPFEQARDVQHRHGGTGLGLAISRQLVRLMGGDIVVESRIGEGSTFRFELELPEVENGPALQLLAQVVTGYTGPRREILVVDDNIENRAVAIDLLAPLGFDMVEACDGAEALELAQTKLPDLILIDLVMPRMDGKEAIRQLRRLPTLEQVPIVALSASVSGTDEAKCLEAGANAFLPKPINQDRLLAQIAALLHIEWNTMPPENDVPIDNHTVPLVVPATKEMRELQRLAQLGNMRDIVQYAKYIAGIDPSYYPFATRLRRLAEGYQSKAILTFVEEHLHDQSN